MGALLKSFSFVTGMPPAMRRAWFGTPVRTLTTLILLSALIPLAVQALTWGVWDATWSGEGRSACQSEGACWVFVRSRLTQFWMGFYPQELWTRPLVALVAVIGGFSGWIFLKRWLALGQRTLLVVVSLILSGWLLLGGFGLTTVATSQWGGLMLTLVITIVGTVAALPGGILLALGRRSSWPILRWCAVGFIEFWRGVPLVTVLFMASVMLPLFFPPGYDVDKLARCLIGVSLFASAYMAEVVRGGLEAVGRGQGEAAHALGLSRWQTLQLVILPQALRVVVPGIVNTLIGLFKDTSLVLIVGMFDLLGMVQSATSDPEWVDVALEGYVFAGAVFWLGSFGLSRLSLRLEKRPEKESK